MDPSNELLREGTRRQFLAGCAGGLGSLALGSLLARDGLAGQAAQAQPVLGRVNLAPHAKRVLWLHMAGGPSQLDLFDDKPLLRARTLEPAPESLFQGERFAFIKGTPKLLGSPHRFARHGQSGAMISELLPHLARHADKLAIVRSMWTEQFNHAPAQFFLNSGHFRIGRPSMGSWLSYGLGRENEDLPAFVVMLSGRFAPSGGQALWSEGFLPGIHQGVQFRSGGDPVLYLTNPAGISPALRRRQLDALARLNGARADALGDPEIRTRVAQYELAYRMQTSVPELASVDSEPVSVREAYGLEGSTNVFAKNCLLARRMLERGVRFVQLYHWGWDSHGNQADNDLVTALPDICHATDRPIAALLDDLERSGMLDETLVVWGGEFGRTPMNEERDGSRFLGRDHHPRAFTMWLAGGGIQPGLTLGATDEFGYHVVERPISVHDLHATLLHQLGFDHERFTYRSRGRDFRLTDVAGEVVPELLA
jgi:uncharacterized protein (DUF1501 family)